MDIAVVPDDVAPMGSSAFGAEQLFQPLGTQYEHWLSIDDQLCPLIGIAPLLELLR